MSYVQKIEHVVEMTQQEFIDMLEARYSSKSPIDANALKILFRDQYNDKGGTVHSDIRIIWHTEETISTEEPTE